ncbi:PREDICTED: F-box protein SKIP31 [Ipomoea nil]|uniref:F-box protein SKIP31 n=1 Tax=Ipomoea nil TaxID=35883 RepID=UPI000900CDE4|nr:PREDICTED: F-box protein SKIP31 [Ipomoea nil]
MAASDDEDESLAQFLESEVLAFSDQDQGNVSNEEEEKGGRESKHMRVEDYEEENEDLVDEEEGRVLKKIRVVKDEGEIEGKEKEDEEQKRRAKEIRVGEEEEEQVRPLFSSPSSIGGASGMINTFKDIKNGASTSSNTLRIPRRIDTGVISKIPPELLHHILKFLSSEDLVSCSLACKFLNYAASDESLWRRLYCMRWGLRPPKRPRESAWKKMYIQRDAEDMGEFVRNCPSEFKEYYIQMQAAKRSQTPLLSQVNDDHIILDKTVADQISIWKKNKGLSDKVFVDHACSGEACTYYQIGDVFVCEKTGLVHVCDDTCREVVSDPTNGLLVCTISGHCFDRMLSPSEIEPDTEQQQGGGTDEAEPFMGSGRFARAYLLGYNCDDEKELEAALRFC